MPHSPDPAGDTGTGQADLVPEDVDEHRGRLDVDVDAASVDAQGEVHDSSCSRRASSTRSGVIGSRRTS